MRIVILILIVLFSRSVFADMTLALEEYEAGNFKKSFSLLHKDLKKKKSGPDLMLLAAHYARGLATKKDFVKVEEILLESEKYTIEVKGCSLNKMAIKYHIFSNYLFKVSSYDPELRSFAESLRKTAESKYAYKIGVCPRLDKVSNFVVY